jgi:peptidoglycan-N-acetylglucosamine deacetylase
MPVFKIPFHLSYLLFISGYSMWAMKAYLNFSLFLCKLTKTSPSVLLHPLDLISGDKIPQLAFFPGMNIPTEKKVEVFKYALSRIKKAFDILPMLDFADVYIKKNKKISEINPEK